MDDGAEYDRKRAARFWLEIPAAGLILLGLGAVFTYWPLGAALVIVGGGVLAGSRVTR